VDTRKEAVAYLDKKGSRLDEGGKAVTEPRCPDASRLPHVNHGVSNGRCARALPTTQTTPNRPQGIVEGGSGYRESRTNEEGEVCVQAGGRLAVRWFISSFGGERRT